MHGPLARFFEHLEQNKLRLVSNRAAKIFQRRTLLNAPTRFDEHARTVLNALVYFMQNCYTKRSENLSFAYETERVKTGWNMCISRFKITHYAKRSQATGQTFLVLCLRNLESRNPHEPPRFSLHENKRQKTSARNLPRMASSRTESAQRLTERGQRTRNHRARRLRRSYGCQRGIVAECVH